MRERGQTYPWGSWSPKTSAVQEPAGWPSTITAPSAELGYPCAVVGPVTVDQAMEWYWRLRTGTAEVHVTAFGGGGIDSTTSAGFKRYNQLPISPANEVLDGFEHTLQCAEVNVLPRVGSPPYSHVPALLTGIHYAEFPSTGGVSWQLQIITQHLWFDDETQQAFFSISLQLDWVKSGGVEAVFRATEQLSLFSSGTLNISTFPTLSIYADGIGDGGEPSLAFTVTLAYGEFYTFRDSNGVRPCRDNVTGAFVTGADYNVENLNDADIVA